MAGMFPTMVADPNDRNRRYTDGPAEAWPESLRIGYWLVLLAAIVMLLTSMLMFKVGVPAEIDPDLRGSFTSNMRIVAVGNIVLALALAAFASYFERGSKNARRWASGMIGLTIFLNFAGFYVGVSGWSAFVIVVLLGLAVFFMFRPAANAFVDHRSGDLWQGVE
ncbi:hypothetical protein M5J20_07550 [Corynebacterium sp. TA-R-1]|uniref:Tellurium resistance protein TerC n=1 Tax=Corynebacterium stercoris TaxID=2943490 RepID=A0ABT1G1Y4_9CORY|nr:hypothetical protein [Corynebacterium stercoris]MCP1388045.1 hypothetical protein [Corynebacterium stercoris]